MIPGALHLTDDAHVACLIGKHGAVSLVRQLTEDVAARDAQISALRARAAERERFLRKIILECGLTSLDLETRLRALEQAQVQAQAQAAASATDSASIHSHSRHVSDLVSDAMSDDHSLRQGSSDYYYNDATIRAASAAGKAANANTTGSSSGNTGTTRGWKDFLWGGTAKKSTSQPSLPNDSTSNTDSKAVRSSSDGRRRTITEDLFEPLPPAASLRNNGRSASRASSISSAHTGHSVHATSRKPSLASLALRLVGAGDKGDSGAPPQSATSAAASLRATSIGSASPHASSATAGPAAGRKLSMGPNGRTLSTSTIGRSGRMSSLSTASIGSGVNGTGAGPRSLMSMRRTNSSAVLNRGTAPQNIAAAGGLNISNMNSTMTAHERWGEMLESSPSNASGDGLAMRRSSYFPVEMDTILPLDVQPPTLTHMYNRYNSSGHLIDRFGFIYDQRRKKRQREAAQVARHIKHGSRHSETLGRPGRRSIKDGPDEPSTQEDPAKDAEPESPTASFDDSVREVAAAAAMPADTAATAAAAGPPKRWQDYLKIATFPTELLSHTPAMSDARIEVVAEGEAAAGTGGGQAVTLPTPPDDAGPKSPGFITSNGKGRGFAPPSMGAMAAPTTSATTSTMADAASITGSTTASLHSDSQSQLTDALEHGLPPLPLSMEQKAKAASLSSSSSLSESLSLSNPKTTAGSNNSSATLVVKDDAEPVRLLLQQLSELHDNLQKDRTVRWNEFLRKVRAERRREGELAAIAASAAASSANATSSSSAASVTDPRFLRATAIMPETRLADGELIGVAGLGNKGKLGRAKWNEFRALVLGGIPVVLRAKVWAECTGATSLRVPGAYDDLVAGRDGSGSGNGNGSTGDNDNGFNGYEDRADVVAQIQADIHRTLTDNIFFREGPGTAKLNEVLLAYARRNPDVGYCQGMNLIAASLLLVTPSAEDAFWLLASIIETILPTGYYDHSLAASRADQQVLRAYVADVLPRLSAHFDALAIDLETMTFQWFLSVFTDCLSAEALFRVWDVVFCLGDGSVFLFQVALALLKLNEAALLRCETPAEIYTYINHQMTNHAISIDGLIQASEALRKLVRREDVEARRATAMDAERALVAARAAAGRERAAARQEKERERERLKRAEEAKQTQLDQSAEPRPEQEQQAASAGDADGAQDAAAAS